MTRVVFSTYGSLGDVHPFLAIAQHLRAAGISCVFVTNGSNVDAVRKAGFEAHGIATDAAVLFERAGYDAEAAVAATRDNVNLFWRIVMPEFSGHLDEIEAIAKDATIIFGPPWAFNAQSVAEKHGIPFIGAHLWPLGFLSAHDPPQLRDLPGLIRPPRSKTAIIWNRVVINCARWVMRRMFAKYLNPPRRDFGLPPISRTPVLDFQLEPARILGLYSPTFVPPAKDFPERGELTGFPMMEDTAPTPDPKLDAFLKRTPIVFTLGSFLSQNPGGFYDASVAAARSLGVKALILTDKPELLPNAPDLLVRGYVPHSRVFPHARVIVHHGGIGTTAQALVAGKPHLVVPHFGDQPDNAARLERLGVAGVLHSEDYTATSAASALSRILTTPGHAERAIDVAAQIGGEDGAARAAEIAQEVLVRS